MSRINSEPTARLAAARKGDPVPARVICYATIRNKTEGKAGRGSSGVRPGIL